MGRGGESANMNGLSLCIHCKDTSEHTTEEPPYCPPSKDSSKAFSVSSPVSPSLKWTTQSPASFITSSSLCLFNSPLHTIHHTHSNTLHTHTHISFLMEQPKHPTINPRVYTFLIKLRKSPHTQQPPILTTPNLKSSFNLI